ncbi:MAG: LysR family transcriptional regulator [Lachnospiraceae bacterium]|nr:LysR family transcriptional regulator [Lachnospiraceae bacterium]
MNLNQLEYFINAAELLNFTRAAEKSFISQTAMTQQIRALEKTIGVPLFLRDKHHVELTTAGKAFLGEARAIVERSNAALRIARTAASGIEGELAVGFIRGFGQGDLNEILRGFHRSYPNIRLSLSSGNMSELLDGLASGNCDAVFTISPYRQRYPDLGHFYMKSFPLFAVVPAGHSLASGQYFEYNDLKDENFIIMQPEGRAKDEAEESMLVYERGGFFPNIVAMEGNPEILLLMISVGLGISILPEYIIRPYQRSADLAAIPLVKADGNAESVDFELSWSLHNTNPAVQQLIETVRESG